MDYYDVSGYGSVGANPTWGEPDPAQLQEEQDQQIVQGLSTGKLVLPSPKDHQRIADNAAARSKIRYSEDLRPEEKQSLLAETFANDAEIRRAAMPMPPEQVARAPETMVQNLVARMPPDLQRLAAFIVPTKDGPQFMRGMPKGILSEAGGGAGATGDAGQQGEVGQPEAGDAGGTGAAGVPGAGGAQPAQAGPLTPEDEARWHTYLQRTLGPVMYKHVKDRNLIPYYTQIPDKDRPGKLKLHFDNDVFKADQAKYAQEHPKGTSPEERAQKGEEHKQEFQAVQNRLNTEHEAVQKRLADEHRAELKMGHIKERAFLLRDMVVEENAKKGTPEDLVSEDWKRSVMNPARYIKGPITTNMRPRTVQERYQAAQDQVDAILPPDLYDAKPEGTAAPGQGGAASLPHPKTPEEARKLHNTYFITTDGRKLWAP